jgi:uncharacterized protein YndB with AHSA1/START domain
MEQKTKITAEEGKQELFITREFNLPVALLFRAHAEADLVSQWMGTEVLELEGKKHGRYQFEKKDPQGKVMFRANGVIHEFIPDRSIIRTFEMENTPFGVQLEVYDFERLTDDTSKLTMHTIYESGALRDQVLKMGMTQGINMVHNRLQEIIEKLKL